MDLNKYLGIPHKPQGRSWEGVDCYGLLLLIYNDLGIELPAYEGWYKTNNDVEAMGIVANIEKQRWKEVYEPQHLDVVLLGVATKYGRFPAHVGIVEEPGWMIHCEYGSEVCREQYTGTRWKNRIEGFFRYE